MRVAANATRGMVTAAIEASEAVARKDLRFI
jgi:hypothetical protein